MANRTATLVCAALLPALAAAPAAAGLERVEKTLNYQLDAGAPVSFENLLGSVTLRGGADPGTIRIEARVVAESKSSAEAQALVETVALDHRDESAGHHIHIGFPVDRYTAFRLPSDPGSGRLTKWLAPLLKRESVSAMYEGAAVQLGRSKGAVALAVHLEVTLPNDVQARVQQRMGTVDCTLIKGDLEIENFEGELFVKRIYGNLDARTAGGNVTLSTAKGAEVRMQTSSGNVELTDVQAERVAVQTGSGRVNGRSIRVASMAVRGNAGAVDLEQVEGGELEVSTTTGKVDLAPRLQHTGRARIESTTGDVVLRVGTIAPFDLQFDSDSGSIKAKGLPLEMPDKDAHAATLRRGRGGAKLRVATQSGQITLQAD